MTESTLFDRFSGDRSFPGAVHGTSGIIALLKKNGGGSPYQKFNLTIAAANPNANAVYEIEFYPDINTPGSQLDYLDFPLKVLVETSADATSKENFLQDVHIALRENAFLYNFFTDEISTADNRKFRSAGVGLNHQLAASLEKDPADVSADVPLVITSTPAELTLPIPAGRLVMQADEMDSNTVSLPTEGTWTSSANPVIAGIAVADQRQTQTQAFDGSPSHANLYLYNAPLSVMMGGSVSINIETDGIYTPEASDYGGLRVWLDPSAPEKYGMLTRQNPNAKNPELSNVNSRIKFKFLSDSYRNISGGNYVIEALVNF